MTNEKILECADYYITNKATLRETAMVFGVSKSNLHKIFNKILPVIDYNKYEEYKKISAENKIDAPIRAGAVSRIVRKLEQEGIPNDSIIVHKESYMIIKYNDDRKTISLEWFGLREIDPDESVYTLVNLLLKAYKLTDRKILITKNKNILHYTLLCHYLFIDHEPDKNDSVYDILDKYIKNPTIKIYSKLIMKYIENFAVIVK